MKKRKRTAKGDPIIPSSEGESRPVCDEESGCLVICPYCENHFNCFSNAESFSTIRCPACKRWFHIHVKMGEKPTEYLTPDDFEKETEEISEDLPEEEEENEQPGSEEEPSPMTITKPRTR